jgi:hypothetical protein
MTIDEKMIERVMDIQKGLQEEFTEAQLAAMRSEAKHLDRGTAERYYWHSGYTSALNDILKLKAN